MRWQRNYYEVLGIAKTATPEEIKKKYHDLARQYHPDRATDKELAQRLFVQINRAYGTLIDSEKRALYDASLFVAAEPPNPSNSAPSRTYMQQAPSASAAGSTAVSASQVSHWLQQAGTLQMKGSTAQAAALCQNVLTAEPRNYAALLLMADLVSELGRHEDALSYYKRAEALQPNNRLLKEKIARTDSIVTRKKVAGTGQATPAARPPSNGSYANRPAATPPLQPGTRPATQNGSGAPTQTSATQPKPAAPSEPAPKQSFFDRIIKRK